VLLIGLLAVTFIGTDPPPAAEALWRVSRIEWANMLARWDTAFYHSIATAGYRWDPGVFQHDNIVFFPLYPLLMRAGGMLVGSPLLAGLIISLVSFAGAVALLHRLAALELGESYAMPVVALLSAYPFALFFSAVYTESLFLLATVGAFYAMRRGRLALVAVAGIAAGLTRPNGWWLSLPLLWMAATTVPSREGASEGARSAAWRRHALLAAMAPIVGAAVFSLYTLAAFGDALAWIHGQAAWGFPLLGRRAAPDPIRTGPDTLVHYTEVLAWTGNIEAFLIATAAIRPITRRLGVPYGLWIVVNIFPPLAAHLFISIGRFTSVLFPMFFWLAIAIPRPKVWRVVAVFAVLQAVFAVWFFLWRPMV
jgi:hypothetical protein